MSTLLLHELREGETLTQTFTTNERIAMAGIRLYLYKHLSPVGNFTLTIKYNTTELASATVTSAIMEANDSNITATNYYHGFIRFDLDSNVILDENIIYTLELSGSGYTYSDSAFIGWVKEFEYPTNTTSIDVSTVDDGTQPNSFQIFNYKRV